MWQHKLRNLVAKFETNASGAIWWPNLHLMQVTASISGSVVPLAMFLELVRDLCLNNHLKEHLRERALPSSSSSQVARDASDRRGTHAVSDGQVIHIDLPLYNI